MRSAWKIAVVAALAVAVAGTVALRAAKRAEQPPGPAATMQPASPAASPAQRSEAVSGRPRILELGSMRCQACLEIVKVLDALRASQGGKLQVDFIDVFEHPDAADLYKISLIPSQILYDASGKEIYRHQGFFSHDDILAKFRELGAKL